MPSITYDRFEGGMDRRKGRGVSDANKLWILKNAYVDTGWKIKKRPGLTLVATLEAGTKGLVPYNSKLQTYNTTGTVTHANPLFNSNHITHSTNALEKVLEYEIFNGYPYIVTEWDNGDTRHHYVDASPKAPVSDSFCPHTPGIVRAATKIFAPKPSEESIAYSAADDATDWSTGSDAGVLATGRQATGSPEPTGLGLYSNLIAVFADDNTQTWNVDPDPANFAISEAIPNIGTPYPESVRNVSGDLYFLTRFGFRSLSTLALTQSLAEVDVGSAIDTFVIDDLVSITNTPKAIFYRGGGQYWCAIDSRIYVFTFSRTAKLSAWCYYEYGANIDDIAELAGILYLRFGDNVYKVDDSVFSDNGVTYEVVAEMHFQDAKKPGQLKEWLGCDVVMSGAADLSWRYDANNTSQISEAISVSGDSRSGDMLPVDLQSTEIAARFVNDDTSDWKLELLQLYYGILGTQ